MLDIIFYRDERDRLAGISARGHADFAAHGRDIVCAAVSAVLQAARLGLQEHAGVELEARQAAGELQLRWPPQRRDSESVRAIVATAELAVAAIARRFPAHVRVRRRRISREPGGRVAGRVSGLADRRRRHDV
ncbi:MAG: ribosomal-processing cysteine protease Prp [Candidatus Eremiobacteraeota bacterium]|nr:ribosomal-processing cysteine protease Prp [Candidatus Eremiobacteraeota bacterium]